MAPKPKLFHSDITKAKLVSFTHIMFLAYLPCSVGCCETDFRLNGGRPVISQHLLLFCENSLLRFEHMCIFVKGCLTFELEYILFRDVIH